jgi:hypothetical protein
MADIRMIASQPVEYGAGRLVCRELVDITASVGLTGRSGIYCHLYDDSAPVVQVTDAHVRLSVSVPDPARVTVEDVTRARELAAAVARYVGELERLADTPQGTAGPDPCPEPAA